VRSAALVGCQSADWLNGRRPRLASVGIVEEVTLPNAFARTVLFVSAYAPLLALFAILDSFHRPWAAWTCAGVAAVGLILLAVFWHVAKKGPAEGVTVVRVTRRDEDVLAFFVTYVVPFAVAPVDSDRVAFALLFFLALVGLLYLRAGIFRVHPVLLLCGVHLYELETTDPTHVVVYGPLIVRSLAPGVFVAGGPRP
jgi:hypothetical protein